VVTHQLKVEHATGKVGWPETDSATNQMEKMKNEKGM